MKAIKAQKRMARYFEQIGLVLHPRSDMQALRADRHARDLGFWRRGLSRR